MVPIPREVLDVERPVNSIVIAYGKNKDHYAVRQRIGCKRVDGRNLPINGPTIGHIVDLQYVPLQNDVSYVAASPIDLKDWANIVLCDRLFHSIQEDLHEVYNIGDSMKIYCIAILRVCNPGIKDYKLKDAYEESFLSELYSGVALSKNTVSKFLNDLGRACSRITQFMRNRTEKVNIDHHLLIDGTLKSDESEVNSYSNFSRKARTKGTRDISVLYAFDLEAMEPVCSKCFPGNMLDSTAYATFIRESGITKGIIVADKGFPEKAAESEFSTHPDLHYLNPIKRNSKLIERHHLHNYTGTLSYNSDILFCKEKCSGTDKWLYSYRDAYLASKEERDWLKRSQKNGYDPEKFEKKKQSFGTVVLECDIDLTPEVVYQVYSQRWEIEIVMRFYKSACEFDETRVHDDYSVIGSEFCDFLSTVLTYRLINCFQKTKLLDQFTYKEIMKKLERAKKAKVDGNSWTIVKQTASNTQLLQDLDLIPKPEELPKRKRGRPKKTVI